MKFTTLFLFLSIVACSAIFRLTNLDLIEFKADEAINLFLATRTLFGHAFAPGSTVSSLGILNPPLFNYFLLPVAIVSSIDPKIISFCIACINALSIGSLFLIFKRYYSLTTAVVAGILLALSPWSILFSRKIWAQDLILPLTVVLLASIHKILLERKTLYWLIYSISSLFLLQLHQSTIFFLLPLTIFLLLQKPKVSLRFIVIGLIFGILPFIPYVSYEIANNCPDCQSLQAATGRLAPVFRFDHFLRPIQIMGQGNFFFIFGGDIIKFSESFPLVYYLRKLYYIEYLLLPFGMFIFWKKFINLRFLIYITAALPILYFLFRVEPLMHYFIILMPLLFLFLGTALGFLLRRNLLLKTFSAVVILSLIALSFTFNVAFFSFLKERGGTAGDYGPIYSATQQKAHVTLAQYRDDPHYEEMLITGYLPKELFYGFLPLAKMIYPYGKTKNSLPSLEERLKEVPVDPRVQIELLAFYTTGEPKRETLVFLRNKSRELPVYQPIYQNVYNAYGFYLAKEFKKLYKASSLDISFEYPSHWTVTQEDEKVIVNGDGYRILIERTTSFNNKRLDCITKEGNWCGRTFKVSLENNPFSVAYTTDNQETKVPPNPTDPKLINTLRVMDDVVNSIFVF